MYRPFTPDLAVEQARSIVYRAAAKASVPSRNDAPLTAGELVGTKGNCLCCVRDPLSGRTAVYAVSLRAFNALKLARGRVTVFIQDDVIVGFVM
ncbi:MAG: hypothetical protein WAJ85_07865 [Candidatus Baltobacteraceae bacterium]|jgi:hypothetical protein